MATMTGHYKRTAHTITKGGLTFDAGGPAYPEALFTVKGARDPHTSFLRFATRVLTDGGVFCDTDADGIPVPCGENTDYVDGRPLTHRPHTNRVYRIKATGSVLIALEAHSAVLSAEVVFLADARPPRSGSGQSSGDVTAAVKRATMSRDRREQLTVRRSPALQETLDLRDAAVIDAHAPRRKEGRLQITRRYLAVMTAV